MLTVQTDVVELLVRTAKNERLPAHCTAGLPDQVRAPCCTFLPIRIINYCSNAHMQLSGLLRMTRAKTCKALHVHALLAPMSCEGCLHT